MNFDRRGLIIIDRRKDSRNSFVTNDTARAAPRRRPRTRPRCRARRGGEVDGLSLEKLRKPALSTAEGNLPVRWEEQKAMCWKRLR